MKSTSAITDEEHPPKNSDIDTDTALPENQNSSIELDCLNIENFGANIPIKVVSEIVENTVTRMNSYRKENFKFEDSSSFSRKIMKGVVRHTIPKKCVPDELLPPSRKDCPLLL